MCICKSKPQNFKLRDQIPQWSLSVHFPSTLVYHQLTSSFQRCAFQTKFVLKANPRILTLVWSQLDIDNYTHTEFLIKQSWDCLRFAQPRALTAEKLPNSKSQTSFNLISLVIMKQLNMATGLKDIYIFPRSKNMLEFRFSTFKVLRWMEILCCEFDVELRFFSFYILNFWREGRWWESAPFCGDTGTPLLKFG